MKENIILAIVADMQRDLDCRQMARLKAVLFKELQDVEITEKLESKEHHQEGNTELLDSFLSAKKIEGCSDKTLAYYRHTIEKMLLAGAPWKSMDAHTTGKRVSAQRHDDIKKRE